MLRAPCVVVVHLGMEEMIVATRACQSVHHFGVCRSTNHTIVIQRAVRAVAAAYHAHSAQREVVLLCCMPCHAGTHEDVVALVAVLRVIVLVFVGLQIVLLAPSSALMIAAMTVSHVSVSIELRTRIVDVSAGIGTAVGVSSHLQRAVISRLAVFLQHDINNAGTSLGREFCRRIVYHLYSLDALGRQLLQYLGTVVGGQSAYLSVYPHLHALVSAQRDVSIVVNLHRRNVLQHVACRATGIGYLLVHVERLTVNLQSHRRLLSCHGDFLEHRGIFLQIKFMESVCRLGACECEFPRQSLIPYVRHLELISAKRQSPHLEVTFNISDSTVNSFFTCSILHNNSNVWK